MSIQGIRSRSPHPLRLYVSLRDLYEFAPLDLVADDVVDLVLPGPSPTGHDIEGHAVEDRQERNRLESLALTRKSASR